MNIIEMMRGLGEMELSITIRHDQWRRDRCFTIEDQYGRICDTGEPLAEMRKYYESAVDKVSGGAFTSARRNWFQ